MINPLVCNIPRVVATSLNELFVCYDPREFANKQLVQGHCNHPRDVAFSLVSMQRPTRAFKKNVVTCFLERVLTKVISDWMKVDS